MDEASAATLMVLLDTSDESSDVDSDDISLFSSSTDYSTLMSSDEEQESHVDFIVFMQAYNDANFKKYFGMNRTTVYHLIALYKLSRIWQQHGSTEDDCEKEMYLFLWYITKNYALDSIVKYFDVLEPDAVIIIRDIAKWLASKAAEYIKRPCGLAKVKAQAQKFEKLSNLRGVVGVLGCSSISISPPKNSEQQYTFSHVESHVRTYERKKRIKCPIYSIHVQAVVDSENYFTDVSCGQPGGLTDLEVLQRSRLYEDISRQPAKVFPCKTCILGDLSYPPMPWLVTPFTECDIDGSLSTVHIQFNLIHEKCRQVLRNAFGAVKSRFKRLLCCYDITDLGLVVNLVMCGCILHNICLTKQDLIEIDDTLKFQDILHSSVACPQSKKRRTEEDIWTRRDSMLHYLLTNHLI